MADIVDTTSSADSTPLWVENVTQYGTTAGTNGLLLGSDTDPVDNHSNLNRPIQQLARRDRWLYDALATLGIDPDTTPASFKAENGIVDAGSDSTDIASLATAQTLSRAGIAQGRLTLATGDPVPSADVTAATTLYYTPYNGDLLSLYNTAESRWDVYTFTERSLSLSGLTANTNYDIFAYDSGGTVTLEAVAWANSGAGVSARSAAISRLNGILVKNLDNRRYLGTIRTTSTAGQCEVSGDKCLLWNVNNREAITLLAAMTAVGIYSYSTAAWRKAYNVDTYRCQVVSGLSQQVQAIGAMISDSQSGGAVGIGINSQNAQSAQFWANTLNLNDRMLFTTFWSGRLNGFSYVQLLEWGGGGKFTGSYLTTGEPEEVGTSGVSLTWEY